jgi:hypothetical protein
MGAAIIDFQFLTLEKQQKKEKKKCMQFFIK